jgi:hypothetical protein
MSNSTGSCDGLAQFGSLQWLGPLESNTCPAKSPSHCCLSYWRDKYLFEWNTNYYIWAHFSTQIMGYSSGRWREADTMNGKMAIYLRKWTTIRFGDRCPTCTFQFEIPITERWTPQIPPKHILAAIWFFGLLSIPFRRCRIWTNSLHLH